MVKFKKFVALLLVITSIVSTAAITAVADQPEFDISQWVEGFERLELNDWDGFSDWNDWLDLDNWDELNDWDYENEIFIAVWGWLELHEDIQVKIQEAFEFETPVSQINFLLIHTAGITAVSFCTCIGNYCPRTGRFTQEDPLSHALLGICIIQAGNMYMFCKHNPVMWQDPSGLYAQSAIDMFFFIQYKFGLRAAMSVNTYRNRAENRAIRLATMLDLRNTAGDIKCYHNVADAFRHFLWTFYMTRNSRLGYEAALMIGNRHELTTLHERGWVISGVYAAAGWMGGYVLPTTGMVETWMNQPTLQDLWNNSVGRMFASESGSSNALFTDALSRGFIADSAYYLFDILGIGQYRCDDNHWNIRVLWDLGNDRLYVNTPSGNFTGIVIHLGSHLEWRPI